MGWICNLNPWDTGYRFHCFFQISSQGPYRFVIMWNGRTPFLVELWLRGKQKRVRVFPDLEWPPYEEDEDEGSWENQLDRWVRWVMIISSNNKSFVHFFVLEDGGWLLASCFRFFGEVSEICHGRRGKKWRRWMPRRGRKWRRWMSPLEEKNAWTVMKNTWTWGTAKPGQISPLCPFWRPKLWIFSLGGANSNTLPGEVGHSALNFWGTPSYYRWETWPCWRWLVGTGKCCMSFALLWAFFRLVSIYSDDIHLSIDSISGKQTLHCKHTVFLRTLESNLDGFSINNSIL